MFCLFLEDTQKGTHAIRAISLFLLINSGMLILGIVAHREWAGASGFQSGAEWQGIHARPTSTPRRYVPFGNAFLLDESSVLYEPQVVLDRLVGGGKGIVGKPDRVEYLVMLLDILKDAPEKCHVAFHTPTLSGQAFVSQMRGVNNAMQGIPEDVVVVAVGETAFQLFQVPCQMLAAYLVKSPHDGPLKEAPNALNAVDMHITYNPLFLTVVDGFVAGVMIGNAKVGRQFVGVYNFRLILDGAGDEVVQGSLAGVRDGLEPYDAAALFKVEWSPPETIAVRRELGHGKSS